MTSKPIINQKFLKMQNKIKFFILIQKYQKRICTKTSIAQKALKKIKGLSKSQP